MGIGTDSPHESAEFEISSNDKGVLLPKLTESEMININNPTEGLLVFCTTCDVKSFYFYDGESWLSIVNSKSFNRELQSIHQETGTVVNEVVSPTGKIWMDRNLGASKVASSPNDAEARGFLYQWGRKNDGHQFRDSGTQTTPIDIDASNQNFIISTFTWYTQGQSVEHLWDGLNAPHNPCPRGFRVPTLSELAAERDEIETGPNSNFLDSPLRFAHTGFRSDEEGNIFSLTIAGFYWSSNELGGQSAGDFRINHSATDNFLMTSRTRKGHAVRCIKD